MPQEKVYLLENLEPSERPLRAGRIFTVITYMVILGMVVVYFNSTVSYWKGVSNQKDKEIEELIKELNTTKLELEKVHANLSLKEKESLGIGGVEKEGVLKVDGELLNLYELFALPPGMDAYYDDIRNVLIPKYKISYSSINLFRAMLALHDSGQMSLNEGWYIDAYGVEPKDVAREKLKTLLRKIRGYESLEGREKIPKLKEAIRGTNLRVIYSFIQSQIANLPGEDYPRFPLETLALRAGDSEDKVVLLAALLEIEGYETGLIVIFDPENNFYHTALAVKDEARWVKNRLMLKGYEKEGFAWILLDPYSNTSFGRLPEWSELYKLPSGAVELPSTKYVFTLVDPQIVKAERDKVEGLLGESKTGIITLERGRKTSINILAVIGERGVLLPVQTEVRSGEGRLLLSIDETLYFTSTQTSIALALKIAKRLAGVSLSDKDIIIKVENPYNETIALSGESAGSSIAIALIANFLNKKIKQDVLLTGTIEEDGRIGKVGGILEKAEAAREAGVKTLLVPKGQKVELPGLDVIEVSKIEDALSYIIE